jgi:hypothetical protein
MDDVGCGAVGGMLGRGNPSTRRKPAPVPLCPPQISHDLNRARTWAIAVGIQRLTARATARPRLIGCTCEYDNELRVPYKVEIRC